MIWIKNNFFKEKRNPRTTSMILLWRRSNVSNFFRADNVLGNEAKLFYINEKISPVIKMIKNFAKSEDAQINQMTNFRRQTCQFILKNIYLILFAIWLKILIYEFHLPIPLKFSYVLPLWKNRAVARGRRPPPSWRK